MNPTGLGMQWPPESAAGHTSVAPVPSPTPRGRSGSVTEASGSGTTFLSEEGESEVSRENCKAVT